MLWLRNYYQVGHWNTLKNLAVAAWRACGHRADTYIGLPFRYRLVIHITQRVFSPPRLFCFGSTFSKNDFSTPSILIFIMVNFIIFPHIFLSRKYLIAKFISYLKINLIRTLTKLNGKKNKMDIGNDS
ncbi:MAG: hypothetical protein GXP14_14855 [Gammaproteobacteria bacterium]|nr:hypothetical protein [Gammaproteobacteria bacterium]